MTIDRDVTEFARMYHAEVIDRSQRSPEGTEGLTSVADFKENAFTSLVLADLSEAGIIDDGESCHYAGQFGSGRTKVNGFGVGEDEDRVDLFTTIYTGVDELMSVSPEAVRTAAERATRFLRMIFQDKHRDMEPSSDAFSMASRIAELRGGIASVRVYVLIDGVSSLTELSPERIGGLPVAFHVWDLERLYRSLGSGRPHATIEIDLLRDTGTALKCLPVPGAGDDYLAYLCVIPGEVLYRLYDDYGARLLELNVRSFLQARGKVNKGIRETIRDDPKHFFAYNNGLALTASEVRVGTDADGHPQIEFLRGLQIVNGGQTTASIHRARKVDRFELHDLFVQAKLTVVPDDQLEEMVPRISKFANSQNAVNEADFSANHPYHIELERLANSTWATGERTRWFYERARGQYQVARTREGGTDAKRRAFDERVPASQKFTKTDLAKYLNTWDLKPHLVSRGGQKNFVAFMDGLRRMGKKWVPDVEYYKGLIAKAILFKSCQKIVAGADVDAYRANVVAYTVALLVAQTASQLDLDEIWQEQNISEPVARTLARWAPLVYHEIVSSAGSRNVGEWAKSEQCWQAVRALAPKLPAELAKLVLAASDGDVNGEGVRLTRDDLANISAVKRINAGTWMAVFNRAIEERRLSFVQRNVCATMGGFASAGWAQDPSPKQAKIALGAYNKIMGE